MPATILLVDDDEFILTVTQEVLEQSGYAIETAEDGLAAWERLEKDSSRFDLLLLDKNMPRLDGISLLKLLKADPRFKDLPVIMLTGDNRQQDIIEGLAEGAHYYLTKPSPEDVLKLVIKNALDEYRQKSDLRALLGQQKNNLNLIHRAEFRYRNLKEARDLALLLADASQDPARTLSGYSELLINAVEHGNLGISYADKSSLLKEGRWVTEVEARLQHPDYADRLVEVTLDKSSGSSRVTITDQGNGFDWRAYIEFSPERVFDLHGRGIAMSKAISFDSLEYVGKGNSVITTVLCQPPAT
jgi:CheY-like chemotaxis protein/anti-sigma regulatory factor (Ser/Thr protein kinase)